MFTEALSPMIDGAINSLRDHTAQLAERFPEHRFTFGYIGNIERWGDDRSWRIFCRYQVRETLSSVSYYLGDTKNLRYDRELAKRIDAWAESLADRLAAGSIFHQF